MDKSGFPRVAARAFLLWLPVVGWMGYIFYCSTISGADIPSLFPYEDVVFHLVVYLILAFLFSRALKQSFGAVSLKRIFLWSVVFAIIYGISDEIHQIYAVGRTPDIGDVMTDGVGACIGSLLYQWQK
ncbi:MAG TPA: VanZ family protein [Candidatus Omnitrophota bacterium]|nr:VanZ family protein [Candidatus Omnitrophota bacterium]